MANPWMTHLNKVREENPDLSLKEAMQEAKKTYTPVGKSASKKSKRSGKKTAKKSGKKSKRSGKKSKRSKK